MNIFDIIAVVLFISFLIATFICLREIQKDNFRKACHSCYYRHKLCSRPHPSYSKDCKHWKLGKCYLCKNLNVTDEEWYKNGCEAECFGGCRRNFKRDWKATWTWIFKGKVVNKDETFRW